MPLLLLLASVAAAQDFARESIEMMPGLTRDQRQALHRAVGKEGAAGAAGLSEDQVRRLVSMPRGPLREERYSHMVVVEVAPNLDRLVAAADAAQAVVVAQREQLLKGLEDPVMRARIDSTCGEQQRQIERKFWRAAWHSLTPDQMRAARELFSPRYRQYPDLPQQLQMLPGLSASQSVKLRSLFAETESENAADLAEVRRIAADLRDQALPQAKRGELNQANGAAYGRMEQRNNALTDAVRATLTKEQLDALHARPPYLGPGELGQPPWEFVREMRLSPEQAARLKQLEQESAKARTGMQPPDMGMMMAEIGAESPQMMAVEVAKQGMRGQIADHFREVGRVIFLDVLTPSQVCDWLVAPWNQKDQK